MKEINLTVHENKNIKATKCCECGRTLEPHEKKYKLQIVTNKFLAFCSYSCKMSFLKNKQSDKELKIKSNKLQRNVFSRNLKILMVDRDINLNELAEHMNKTPSGVSAWCHAICLPRSEGERVRLCELFNVSYDYLFCVPIRLSDDISV